jgi:hypothetical protein
LTSSTAFLLSGQRRIVARAKAAAFISQRIQALAGMASAASERSLETPMNCHSTPPTPTSHPTRHPVNDDVPFPPELDPPPPEPGTPESGDNGPPPHVVLH